MEILFFEPVYKDYIWGGTRLKEYFNKDIQTPTSAESWEISTNEAGLSKIANGAMKGDTLKKLFDNRDLRAEVFGTKTKEMEKFPLLIKYIDANSNLSVQVHPNDEYAKKNENDSGKTEMWYIIDCAKDAKIICGMKENVTNKDVDTIIRNGKIKENLNYINIQKGDAIYIPSGTIHAILGDTLICEIQQNSNLTYRVYDWDRVGNDGKPRELHIEKAIDVIDVETKPRIVHTIGEENKMIVENEFFKVERIVVDKEYRDKSNEETFYAMNILEGSGKIEANNKEYDLSKGDSILIPANIGKYVIRGRMQLLKSYIG
ncbi:MAG: mannose-6-phosphate isomerase, class I [Clostridia bacterium]|nr:mannose-6-phosphate isomerase, class I [Clostridia bacterium]